ncbi:hypothetical protein [Streptomyces sp. NPDC094049]|uniref:hypothetical protein n=1 Tax=Streptomyces sp. NPDC094049 TaxID=3154987 RepID=UPI00331A7FCC
MHERNGAPTAPTSHLTQPDEALRQIRQARTAPLSDREQRTRAGLTWIAQQLATHRTAAPMEDVVLESAIGVYVRTHLRDDRDANATSWDLRETAPAIPAGATRAEYAARLQLHLQGVTG